MRITRERKRKQNMSICCGIVVNSGFCPHCGSSPTTYVVQTTAVAWPGVAQTTTYVVNSAPTPDRMDAAETRGKKCRYCQKFFAAWRSTCTNCNNHN